MNIMNKKMYEQPFAELIKIQMENNILSGGTGGIVDPIEGDEE
jgi:hypothetical protein